MPGYRLVTYEKKQGDPLRSIKEEVFEASDNDDANAKGYARTRDLREDNIAQLSFHDGRGWTQLNTFEPMAD